MPDPSNFTVRIDRTRELTEALKQLADTKVMVGIPSDSEPSRRIGTEARGAGDIGNAALGYIHETGSPAQNIPVRPWLSPGVSNSRNSWLPYLQQAARLAFEGRVASVDRALNACGIAVVSAVKNRIAAGIPPPLKPATVRARRRRSRGSTYRRRAAGPSDVTPLIDTGQLINAIAYVIRRKKP